MLNGSWISATRTVCLTYVTHSWPHLRVNDAFVKIVTTNTATAALERFVALSLIRIACLSVINSSYGLRVSKIYPLEAQWKLQRR